MFQLGTQSRKRLEGVHPTLVRIVERAIQLTTVDFMVLEGVRTKEKMAEYWGKGRSYKQMLAAGIGRDWAGKYAAPQKDKVTWLKNPFNSNHAVKEDGYGHAVDLVPYPVDWNDTKKFDAIATAMQQAARELSTEVRWGADWDRDGKPRERGESDSPHFEI